MSNLMLAQQPFYTVQGEGKYVGTPTLFVRFAGCNLRCKGFSQPNPKDPSTYHEIEVQNIKSLEEYTTPRYGCDTSYAVDAEYSHFWLRPTLDEFVEDCLKLVGGSFNKQFGNIHLAFTGGEPMMKQDVMRDIIKALVPHGLKNVTIETNGTLAIKDPLIEASKLVHIFMSVSPKLWCCSGITPDKGFKPEVLNQYRSICEDGQLKYVCGDDEEVWNEVKQNTAQLKADHYQVIIMPVGGNLDQINDTSTKVAERCMKEGYRFSPRLHIYLWSNSYDT